MTQASRLIDVADAAGVSLRTASRVLNDDHRVAADTRERVQQAMRTLKFQPDAVARRVRLERWDLVAGPVAGLAELLARKRPEAIVHLAAQANPQRSVADPRGTWTVNLFGALNLLEAVRAAALEPTPRVVLVGSGVAYGNPAPEHLPVSEACPLRPNNPYAASKAAADLLGVAVPANLLFFVASIVLMVLTLQHSYELGRLEEKTRTLAEDLAILRMEVEASHRDGPEGRDGATVPLPPDPDV